MRDLRAPPRPPGALALWYLTWSRNARSLTDVLDRVRDHYRATGLTERLKAALVPFGTAATYGCRVKGVELSEPFVNAARYLTERTRQSGQVSFEIASALELPFVDGQFDLVWLQHVAMNISERAQLYREIRRVLKSGGRFATFDVVLNSGEPLYPLPWARTPATSFLLTAAATREAVESAGFRTLVWQDDTEAAKAWFAQLLASQPSPSPNLSVVMGSDFPQLAANLGRSLMQGRVSILTAVLECRC
jgi:sarcosine/dimethylglycine N-methyltransferase